LERAVDAIVLLDDRGNIMDANAAACELLGYIQADVRGRRFAGLVAPATPQLQPPFTTVQRGELSVLSTSGRLQYMEYTLTPDVQPHGHLLVLRDISQRKVTMETELWWQRQRVDLFSEVILKIRQSLQLTEILHTMVTEVQRILQADRVLIYRVLPDGTGKTISEAVLPDYPVLMDLEFPEEVFPEEYHHLYARGRVRAIADVHAPKFGLPSCLVEFVEQFDIKAKLIVPIVQSLNTVPVNPATSGDDVPRTRLWGLLIAHQCRRTRQWVEFELELMQQLANQISMALAQAELREHLEEMIEARTAALQRANRDLHQQIRDHRQAEATLRQSEEQLRRIINALPLLIAYVDDQQLYRFNNRAYCDWLGQPPDAIYGSHLARVWGRECYRRMSPHIVAALSGQVVSYENEIQLRDGRVRSVDVTYIPHRNDQNQVQGFFSLTSDISDRKAIERMKDEFISVVSHELRTPLTSLHSALKILATGRLGTLSGEGQHMLEIANDSTERLVRLVNNVLDLQRIESGEVVMAQQACQAEDLLTQATEAMQAMANQQGVHLEMQSAQITVWADADYILQALTNLLSNAIKFSAPGHTVWLTVARRSLTTPITPSPSPLSTDAPGIATEAIFQVRDQGQGIPPDKLECIFERFQQVDSSDSRKKGGTGLGLTICRQIIEQHNGKIWAESTPGKGSTFSFTLPALES
jgi:PAS domain S-box-containing protein